MIYRRCIRQRVKNVAVRGELIHERIDTDKSVSYVLRVHADSMPLLFCMW